MATNQSTETSKKSSTKVTPLDSRRTAPSPSARSDTFMQDLRLRLSYTLQTSLDSQQVVNLFFQEVQSAVAVDGIEYKHNGTGTRHQCGKVSKHRASYHLNTRDEHFGEIEFTRRRRFIESELIKLESLLDLFIYPIRNALRYQEAVQSALKDPLTGVGNRLALSNALRHEIELSRRYTRHLSVLMLDLDHFKCVNDLYGHQAGDVVLKTVATVVGSSLREVDAVFRLGGEEFLVLLPDTSIQDALLVGERVRNNIAECEFNVAKSIDVTVSMGIAEYACDMSFDDLIRTADEAMYRAKRSGRNQIQAAR